MHVWDNLWHNLSAICSTRWFAFILSYLSVTEQAGAKIADHL